MEHPVLGINCWIMGCAACLKLILTLSLILDTVSDLAAKLAAYFIYSRDGESTPKESIPRL